MGLKTEFVKTLKALGFKAEKGLKDCYGHDEHGWYAEVIKHTDSWVTVWMVGKGLKHTGFPGGWIYESPEEIENACTKAITTA